MATWRLTGLTGAGGVQVGVAIAVERVDREPDHQPDREPQPGGRREKGRQPDRGRDPDEGMTGMPGVRNPRSISGDR